MLFHNTDFTSDVSQDFGFEVFVFPWKLSSMLLNYSRTHYVLKCSKISNALHFLFSTKVLVIRAGIHKMLLKIANKEDPDQPASSDLGLHCLSRHLRQATHVRNFRTLALAENIPAPWLQGIKHGPYKYKYKTKLSSVTVDPLIDSDQP